MRRLTFLQGVTALVTVVVLGAAIAWFWRIPVADAVLREALRTRGVRASYEVKEIGLRWERVENVRIGDPRAPDLTADWAEVRVTTGLSGLSVDAVRAGGVRVRGRLVNGTLRLGDLDRLFPASRSRRFALPSVSLELFDLRARVDSPFGAVGLKLDGKGNVANGFVGKVAVNAPKLRWPECVASRTTAHLDVGVQQRRLNLRGPARAGLIACDFGRLDNTSASINLTLNEAFDRWRGSATVESSKAQTPGIELADLKGRLGFAGDRSKAGGTINLAAESGALPFARASKLSFDGRLDADASVSGKLRAAQVRLDPDGAKRLAVFERSVSTFQGSAFLLPMVRSARAATRQVSIDTNIFIRNGTVSLNDVRAFSATGAKLVMQGGRGVRFGVGGLQINTDTVLSGGGLPSIAASFRPTAPGMSSGVAKVGPIVAPAGRIILAPVRFAVNARGTTRLETALLADGQLAGARLGALQFPLNATISAMGDVVINNGCTPASWQSIAFAGLALSRGSFSLCPVAGGALIRMAGGKTSGGAIVRAPRLEGQLGAAPFVGTAASARLNIARRDFSVDDLAIVVGTRDGRSQLNVAGLSGQLRAEDLTGRFENLQGSIANLPLLVGQARGDWRQRAGALTLAARGQVSDAAIPSRFNPLVAQDFALKFADGRVSAVGALQSPSSDTVIVRVTIDHVLESGIGSAALDVPVISFGKSLQPEALTRLTLGVVANVEGSISGRGTIRWDPRGVSSSGKFSTAGLNLAAAFGPVTGLKGEIEFDDLLALASPPAQQVTIASINPGTLITDGRIRYRLLPDQRIEIEDGYWPFAGGELRLDPGILDMREERERRLTFRVIGLDAAKFVQRLEFENLAATGLFDGVLPIYFDANGGRIDNGRLVARPGGGTLAYVGEVSNASMNVFAKLAFDALKSIRYDNLTIELDGALDGEIVSLINFRGVNEAPLGPPRGLLARQFTGLPFIFNITVRAPFRSLLTTARSFQDPSALLQRTLPELETPGVQPRESDVRLPKAPD